MTAKEYLQQVKLKGVVVANLQREKENIRQLMYSIGGGVGVERVQTSRNNDKFGTLYGRMDEKESQIDEKLLELIEFKLKVSGEINGLNDARYINLLYMRYMDFRSWDEIAIDMKYSTRHVLKVHKEALAEFEQKYHAMLQQMVEETEEIGNGEN